MRTSATASPIRLGCRAAKRDRMAGPKASTPDRRGCMIFVELIGPAPCELSVV
ncbi:hypothetical protein [Mycolicibacterium iranicum]|uniref:hypothetical protein n=1 Tax=Mycolicibacterium iranicum TaxID=912594 RepID=UPI0013F4DC64|nr:hypothetical protein [Mycolicibacterium iranicum]